MFELPRIKFLAVLNQIENSLLQKLSEFIEELLHPHVPLYISKENQVKTFGKPTKNNLRNQSKPGKTKRPIIQRSCWHGLAG